MLKNSLSYKVTPYVIFSAILLMAAVFLRFHDLADRSLWYDELAAANNSIGTLTETLSNTRQNNSSPILYPVLLNIIESVDTSPAALRLPSAIASVLIIVVMLSLPRVGIDKRTAFLAALLLTFSASQIRYAQEVREYSLSVLITSIMLYSCFSYCRDENRRYLFLAVMFLAPLVQYGLVFFAAALLIFAGAQQLYRHGWKKAISMLMLPTLFLLAGGAISAWMTLRFQWQMTSAWYLSSSYFDSGYGDVKALVSFIVMNTYRFFDFVMPPLAFGLAIPTLALAIYGCSRKIQCNQQLLQIAMIAIVAVLIVLLASIAHVYPFGGIRQVLFLSPVVALLFAASFLSLSHWFPIEIRRVWFAICIVFVVIAGAVDIKKSKPYAEVQDIKSVIEELEGRVAPGDAVYIYGPARIALDYYQVEGDNFLYGKYHRNNPEKYLEEISELVRPEHERLWLVFSNTYKDEERLIIEYMTVRWKLTKMVDAEGAALYMGVRRIGSE